MDPEIVAITQGAAPGAEGSTGAGGRRAERRDDSPDARPRIEGGAPDCQHHQSARAGHTGTDSEGEAEDSR